MRSRQLRFNSNFDGVKLVDSEKSEPSQNADCEQCEVGTERIISPLLLSVTGALLMVKIWEDIQDIHMFMLFLVTESVD